MNMIIFDKFFRYSIKTILVLVIIFLIGQLGFFINPIKSLIAVVFTPLLIAGLLYYLLRPLVRFAVKVHINRTVAILLIFLIIAFLIVLMGTYAGSLISKQFKQFTSDLPGLVDDGGKRITQFIKDNNLDTIFNGDVQKQITGTLQDIIPIVSGSILGAISTVTSILAIVILVPFILFYFLKDDALFEKRILNVIPLKFRDEAAVILAETDKTLSTYIIGQAILAIILGALTFIGYLIIGIKYPLVLALFATLTSFIPMFGTAIGATPAVIIGLAYDPFMVIKILIVVITVQQLEGNLISPFVVGKRLDIHPLVVILLFLIATKFYGFIGMLIAVPAYAVIKVLFKNGVRIYKLRKTGKWPVDET